MNESVKVEKVVKVVKVLKVAKVVKVFQVYQNIPGSQLLSDIQTFFSSYHQKFCYRLGLIKILYSPVFSANV